MKKRVLLKYYFIICIFFLSSCGSDEFDASSEDCPTDRCYEYESRGCTTGRQLSATTDEMCLKLEDDELNDNCAFEERDVKKEQWCSQ